LLVGAFLEQAVRKQAGTTGARKIVAMATSAVGSEVQRGGVRRLRRTRSRGRRRAWRWGGWRLTLSKNRSGGGNRQHHSDGSSEWKKVVLDHGN
jgi:hypothetical protein